MKDFDLIMSKVFVENNSIAEELLGYLNDVLWFYPPHLLNENMKEILAWFTNGFLMMIWMKFWLVLKWIFTDTVNHEPLFAFLYIFCVCLFVHIIENLIWLCVSGWTISISLLLSLLLSILNKVLSNSTGCLQLFLHHMSAHTVGWSPRTHTLGDPSTVQHLRLVRQLNIAERQWFPGGNNQHRLVTQFNFCWRSPTLRAPGGVQPRLVTQSNLRCAELTKLLLLHPSLWRRTSKPPSQKDQTRNVLWRTP